MNTFYYILIIIFFFKHSISEEIIIGKIKNDNIYSFVQDTLIRNDLSESDMLLYKIKYELPIKEDIKTFDLTKLPKDSQVYLKLENDSCNYYVTSSSNSIDEKSINHIHIYNFNHKLDKLFSKKIDFKIKNKDNFYDLSNFEKNFFINKNTNFQSMLNLIALALSNNNELKIIKAYWNRYLNNEVFILKPFHYKLFQINNFKYDNLDENFNIIGVNNLSIEKILLQNENKSIVESKFQFFIGNQKYFYFENFNKISDIYFYGDFRIKDVFDIKFYKSKENIDNKENYSINSFKFNNSFIFPFSINNNKTFEISFDTSDKCENKLSLITLEPSINKKYNNFFSNYYYLNKTDDNNIFEKKVFRIE